MAKKTIYLDDVHEKLWDSFFKGGDQTASGWIQEKLDDEYGKTEDPFILLKQIEEHRDKMKSEESQIKVLQNKLDEVKIKKRIMDDHKAAKLDKAVDAYRLNVLTKTILGLYSIEEQKASKIAEEYLLMDAQERPELPTFLRQKMVMLQ